MPNAQVAYLETIEEMLQESKIKEATKALLKFLAPQVSLHADIMQQSGTYYDVEASFSNNLINFDERKRVISNIRYALLNMVSELRERAETENIGTVPEQTITTAKDENTTSSKSKPTATAPVSAVPKFVILYDLADTPQSQILNKHLNVLKFTKKIRVYNVQEGAGDLLAAAETELADADYLLVLVTVNIFNSPDWFGLIVNALEQGRRIIPIRIEKADYDGTGLEKLRSLPSLGRAVSDFPNLDAAYADIVTELKKLLPK